VSEAYKKRVPAIKSESPAPALFFLVPGAGLEPAWTIARWILSYEKGGFMGLYGVVVSNTNIDISRVLGYI